MVLLMAMMSTACRSQTFTDTRVIQSPRATRTELAAIHLLTEEAAARTGQVWPISSRLITADRTFNRMTFVIARASQVPELLPLGLRQEWRREAPSAASRIRPEGFDIQSLALGGGIVVIVAGNDSRGVLYGVGYVLRKLEFSAGAVRMTKPLNVIAAPEVPVRSHQIGYRFKNNTYDGWTLAMFEQQIRDLAVFGITGLQVIAPHSDDAPTSPLFPAPAFDTVVGISSELKKYGLDCELYYPEMRADYGAPSQVNAELADFEILVKAMPRLDAIYVPGGDPGHTAPKYLFPLVAKQAAILQRYHPGAKVWISAQGFDRANCEEFYRMLQGSLPWLTGVFFGPQSRDSFEVQRARISARYRMLFYPDIGHTMHAQFPVPQWDPAFAMTEGREPIDPRPDDTTLIYRHFASLHTGFVAYSEGVNDDVNKFLWTRLGWSKETNPAETLEDYARYFLGPTIGGKSSGEFASAIMDLERDWRGPIRQNQQIRKTAEEFEEMEREAPPRQALNWRFEMLLYRAYYDSYLQVRLAEETKKQESSLQALHRAKEIGTERAIEEAEQALEVAPGGREMDLRGRIYDLAGRLFQHVRLQLSVKLYGASGVERGANLDRVDLPLNDRIWLEKKLNEIRRMPVETARVAALEQIANWSVPTRGALYDDLGDPEREPHLMRGFGFSTDPEMYNTAIDGIADKTTEDGWKISQLTYAETLYEVPLTLRYDGLNSEVRYRVRATYAGEDYTLPLTLVANGITLHSARLRKSNPEIVEFEVPEEAIRNGVLELQWQRPSGLGGSGRGCQVAEVWLIPETQ